MDWYQWESDDFLGRIIAVDETWARSYKPNLKRQSYEWKNLSSPRPKKVRPTQCTLVLFIAAYGIDGVMLHHPLPPRQTVNAAYKCTFLQHYLPLALKRKRRQLLIQNPIILHCRARSHTSAAITELLRRFQWDILDHPLYSPDRSPCDYDIIAEVKEPLRGTRYSTRDELIRAIVRSIRNINKDGSADGVQRLSNI